MFAYDLIRLQEVPADQGTPEGQKCLMDVSTFFVPHAQATKLIQPRKGSFHDPPPSSQTAAVFSVALRKKRHDVSATQTLADRLSVITTVAHHAIRTMPWTSALSL